MKKYCIVIVALFLFSFKPIKTETNKLSVRKNIVPYIQNNNLNRSDTLISDTLSYVKNLINNKVYAGKELSVFLNDLKIPVVSYLYYIPHNNRFISTGLSISLSGDVDETYKRSFEENKPTVIIVHWQTPVPVDSVYALIKMSNGQWLNAERQYYQKQIIKDIAVINYAK